MDKTLRSWFLGGCVVLVALPWLISVLISPEASWLLFLLLLFSVDPMFFLLLGASAGKDVKKRAVLPFACILLFALGVKLGLDMPIKPMLGYAGVYLGLSLAAMGITFLAGKWRGRKQKIG